jgi:hypothetical protein
LIVVGRCVDLRLEVVVWLILGISYVLFLSIFFRIRIAVRAPTYVEACDDGRNVAHSSSDFHLVRDRDTMNMKELT